MAPPQDPRKLAAQIIAMAAAAIILLWCLYLIRGVLLLIYVSMVLAIGFSPIVRLIERQGFVVRAKRVPRWAAILVLYVLVLGVMTAIGIMIVPQMVEQARELWTAAPKMTAQWQDWLVSRGLLPHRITLQEAVQQAPGPGDAVGTVVGAIAGFLGGLFGLVTILILTFYFLVEGETLRSAFLQFFPAQQRGRIAKASRDATVKISAWLNGQLLLAAIIGGTAAIGLWLMSIPYFYVLALIAGIGEMIPVVGPLVAAIPAVGVAATISWEKALFVAIFFLIQQQFENHVLVPKIMERQVGISPVMVIIALLVGGGLLGIVGAILAVPTAAIVQVVFQQFLQRDE
ncbi:MAG TPA: AI-2E family transporter [Vicinamibacterales bacterium]|nr:AI-2E family transporter [Vicinamibacterales bacterium]